MGQTAVIPLFPPTSDASRKFSRERSYAVSPAQDWRSRLHRAAIWLILADIALFAFVSGVRLRIWTWEQTKSARFTWDIQNGHHWGSRIFDSAQALAAADGHFGQGARWRYFLPAYAHLYDQVVAESDNDKYQLDYSPARLMVMALWVRHVRLVYPQTHSWMPQYAYTSALLRFNTCCELLAAIFAFMLVRHWMNRQSKAERQGAAVRFGVPPPTTFGAYSSIIPASTLCGLFAALLIWFNPAMLADAHVWPQWDVWLLPFLLGATLAASLDWWFCAGAILALGAMFKGQLVMVAPLLLLWPLFAGWWSALARIVIGAGFSLVLITCCWLVPNSTAWLWVGGVMLACLIVAAGFSTRHLLVGCVLTVPAVALVVWPSVVHGHHPHLAEFLNAIGMLVLVIGGERILFGRARRFWVAAVFAAAVFSAYILFNGSMAWQKVGYGYPTYHFPWMVVGESANLAAILSTPPFLWQLNDIAMHIRLPALNIDWAVTIKFVLVGLYAIALVLCAIGAARLSRRNDRRFLLVPGATCLLMFALLPQMHERYLLWGAMATALAVGVSGGMTLLHLMLTAFAFEMIVPYVLERDPRLLPGLHRFFAGVFPGDSWAVLLCAAVFLYQILKTPTQLAGSESERPVSEGETAER